MAELSRLEMCDRLANGWNGAGFVSAPPQYFRRAGPRQFPRSREVVSAGGLDCVRELSADWNVAAGCRRSRAPAALAEWVTDPRNPLPARVIVNRLWHYHFGVGLVDTPNDFGFNGGRPSHGELLDWLANEFDRTAGV